MPQVTSRDGAVIEASVTSVEGTAYEETATALGPAYDIEPTDDMPEEDGFVIRFPSVTPPDGEGVFVATRESDGEQWRLLEARRVDGGVAVRVDGFSQFQPLSLDVDLPDLGDLRRFAGTRVDDPGCAPRLLAPVDVSIRIESEDPDDPLLWACPLSTADEPAVQLISNRGIGIEFDLPAGTRVASVKSPTLVQKFLEPLESAQLGTPWRLLPSGGELVLAFDEDRLPNAIEFTAAPTATVFELAAGNLDNISNGFIGCAYEALGDQQAGSDPTNVREALARVQEIFLACANFLKGEDPVAKEEVLVRALAVVAKAGADVLALTDLRFPSPTATMRFRRRSNATLPAASPASGSLPIDFAPDGEILRVGGFDASSGDRDLAATYEAFGEPSSVESSATGCEVRWPNLGLTAYAVNYGDRSAECMPSGGYLATFVITSDAFETDRGLRVSSMESELRQLYPAADTRGSDASLGPESSPPGTLYDLESVSTQVGADGARPSMQGYVVGGQVEAIEVNPYFGGD